MFANHNLRTKIQDVVPTEYLSAETLLKILLANPITEKEALEQYNDLDNFIEKYFAEAPSLLLFEAPISPEGFTAFEIAVLLDDKTLLEKLHHAGSKPNAPGIDGLRPVHLAAERSRLKALDYLHSVRCDLNIKHSVTGYTPLMYAAWNDNADTIHALHKLKARLDDVTSEGLTAAGLATQQRKAIALLALKLVGADLNAPAAGYVPLMIAVDNRFSDMLRILCAARANINARQGCQITGATALFKAVKSEYQDGVDILLKTEQAELDYRYTAKGRTAIFQAAILGNLKIFTWLFERRADIHIPANLNPLDMPADSHAQPFTSLRRCIHFKNQAAPRSAWNTILAMITHKAPPVYRIAYPATYSFSFKRNDILEDSTCLYGYRKEQVNYRFSKELGRSDINLVYTMIPDAQAAQAGYKPIAVKEFMPVQRKFFRSTVQEAEDIFTDYYPEIIHETHINYLIHGVGAFFCDLKPIKGHLENNVLHILDYPRCYMAMKHFAGVPLHDFTITCAQQYFQIFIELMYKLERLHAEFVHGDLAARNVIVDNQTPGTMDVNIIDFNTTRKHGEIIDITFMKKSCKPPEFAKTRFIKANTNQDIYCLGLMMNEELKKYFFLMTPHVIDQLETLLHNMLSKNPLRRIDLEKTIKAFGQIYALQLVDDFQQIDNCKREFVVRKVASSDYEQNKLIGRLTTKEWQLVIKTSSEFLKIFPAIKPDCQHYFINTLSLVYLQKLPLGENEILNQAEDFLGYIKKLDETYHQDSVDYTLKIFLAKMITKFGYARVLSFCDAFEKSQPDYFKRMLLICNQIYQDNRSADPRRYYSIFGWYSKEAKIEASKEMEATVTNNRADFSIFKQGALNQGDLGKIATRLRRCC